MGYIIQTVFCPPRHISSSSLYIPNQTSSFPLLGHVFETVKARHLTWLVFIQTTAHPLLPSFFFLGTFTHSFSLLSMSPSSLFQWKLPEALAQAVHAVCLIAGPCLLLESCEKAITLHASEMNHNHNHISPAPVPSFISHEWTVGKWMLTFVYTALTMSSLYCVVVK